MKYKILELAKSYKAGEKIRILCLPTFPRIDTNQKGCPALPKSGRYFLYKYVQFLCNFYNNMSEMI